MHRVQGQCGSRVPGQILAMPVSAMMATVIMMLGQRVEEEEKEDDDRHHQRRRHYRHRQSNDNTGESHHCTKVYVATAIALIRSVLAVIAVAMAVVAVVVVSSEVLLHKGRSFESSYLP